MVKRVVYFLVILKIQSPALCHPSGLPDRASSEEAYTEGREIFYATLKEKAAHVQLEEEDRKKITEAQKRIPGLYEHLMNFLYLLGPLKRHRRQNLYSYLLFIYYLYLGFIFGNTQKISDRFYQQLKIQLCRDRKRPGCRLIRDLGR